MIDIRGLTKRFGSTTAVANLSFCVQPGRVTGFLGPNGAGKSTTMRMVLGLDRPTAGQATIFGRPFGQLKNPMRTVGGLLDAGWVHPNRSAHAHLKMLAAANRIPSSRVDAVLDEVGLTSVAGKGAGKFSLGMKQRLGIAAALLGDPGVLLFDEPVNGLDPEGILWVRTLMQKLAQQGRTVLVSSHLLSEMAQTADHLVVIGRGQLIADVDTATFIANSTTSSVLVRSPRLNDLVHQLQAAGAHCVPADGGAAVTGMPIEQIGELAASAQVPLHELSPQRGSLEEAFIMTTGAATEFAANSGGAR